MGQAIARRVADLDAPDPSPTRDQVIARYRRLRAISREHNSAATDLLPGDALLRQARRLGLAKGRTFVLDDVDELFYAMDLAVYTAPPERISPIERYGRSAGLPAGSDEACVLEAMRRARFAILLVERRHPAAGLIARDTARDTELWLMDEGLEISLAPEAVIATRIYDVGDFCMTAGVFVPFEPEIFAEAVSAVPFLRNKTLAEALADRRFAEAIYRAALADGVIGRTHYQDVPAQEPV